MKYFIGNWKMFGVPKSVNIINKINFFVKNDRNRNKYRIVLTPPYTLIETFAKYFKNKLISIGAQNCFHKDLFSSNTGAVSPYMLKQIGSKYIIIGHSDNRSEGDNDQMLRNKVRFALKHNLRVIFCIGENKKQKKNKKTFTVLKQQLSSVLEKKFKMNNIIIAYEPIWSIGTGMIPSSEDLIKNTSFIKKTLKKIFNSKKTPPVLYGGSVDSNNIEQFSKINIIDGFLIGGASKSSKKFIDIIKNYYR